MANREGVKDDQQLTFGRFVLDLRRGVLLLDGREVGLRPKTFAVLCFLVQHPGRLVSKEELLAAVWPNLVVTDDTLVQSIGELRRALGDAGSKLIVTVPRRGYRFEASEAPPDRRKARSARRSCPSRCCDARSATGFRRAMFAAYCGSTRIAALIHPEAGARPADRLIRKM